MNKPVAFVSGIFLFVLLSAFFVSVKPGPNGWRGENRDGVVKGFITPTVWPSELKQVWKVTVGLGDASPVLVDNRLYLTTKRDSSEVTLCLEASSGKLLWEKVNNKAPVVTGGAASHPGPRSTPAVTEEMVITIGAGGYVVCRNRLTGELVWQSDAFTGEVPQFFVGGSPLVLEKSVIAHLMGKDKGAVVALRLNDGSELWRLEGESSTYSSPVSVPRFKNMIAVQGEKSLFGVSADKGELLWKVATPGESRFYNSSTPVVWDDQIFIAGQGSGARNFRIIPDGGSYRAEEVWKTPEVNVSFNTPVLKEGYLYGNEARFGSFFCINALTGARAWSDTLRHNRFASTLDLGKVMVSLPATGWLIFFKPDGTQYQEVARYKVADTEVYAHPVIAGKFIYVKDKETLTCWGLN